LAGWATAGSMFCSPSEPIQPKLPALRRTRAPVGPTHTVVLPNAPPRHPGQPRSSSPTQASVNPNDPSRHLQRTRPSTWTTAVVIPNAGVRPPGRPQSSSPTQASVHPDARIRPSGRPQSSSPTQASVYPDDRSRHPQRRRPSTRTTAVVILNAPHRPIGRYPSSPRTPSLVTPDSPVRPRKDCTPPFNGVAALVYSRSHPRFAVREAWKASRSPTWKLARRSDGSPSPGRDPTRTDQDPSPRRESCVACRNTRWRTGEARTSATWPRAPGRKRQRSARQEARSVAHSVSSVASSSLSCAHHRTRWGLAVASASRWTSLARHPRPVHFARDSTR
jgi:hypothetical protein